MAVLRQMVGTSLPSDELTEIVRNTLGALTGDRKSNAVGWEQFYLTMSQVDVKRLMSLQYTA